MSTTARKARKRAGIQFYKAPKTRTVTYANRTTTRALPPIPALFPWRLKVASILAGIAAER